MNHRKTIEQSMLGQQTWLIIVRRRHLGWANSTHDLEMKRRQNEIADLTPQITFEDYDLSMHTLIMSLNQHCSLDNDFFLFVSIC